jgi:hypothetical protein
MLLYVLDSRHRNSAKHGYDGRKEHVNFICNIYVVCSKSIEPLIGRNTFIDLEVQNPNPLQSSLLGNAHTSPSASAIVGNTSGTRLLEW